MSICLDVVRTDQQIGALEHQESTVRVIGEILPYVIAKYGIRYRDGQPEFPQDSGQLPAD